MLNIALNFDLDGTLADLYAVEDWLPKLRAQDPTPYAEAAVMWHMATLARMLNRLQRMGVTLRIISWLSKESTPAYDAQVIAAKKEWLARHLKSVKWDEMHFLAYGTPKRNYADPNRPNILIDDEARNRKEFGNIAVDAKYLPDLLHILAEMGD